MSLNHWFKLTHKRGISPSMTRIFSILVCNNLLRMIKLSRLGGDPLIDCLWVFKAERTLDLADRIVLLRKQLLYPLPGFHGLD